MSKRSIINTSTRGNEAKQSIATPWALIHALEQRFGTPVDFDLCATDDNKKVRTSAWFGPGSAFGEDALKQDWSNLGATKLAFARRAGAWPPRCAAPSSRRGAGSRGLPPRGRGLGRRQATEGPRAPAHPRLDQRLARHGRGE